MGTAVTVGCATAVGCLLCCPGCARPAHLPALLCRRSARVVKARFQGELVAAKIFDLSKSQELQASCCSGGRGCAAARRVALLPPAGGRARSPPPPHAAAPARAAAPPPPAQESFLTECSRLALLRYPHIITLLGMSLTADNKGVLLMELAEGEEPSA